MRDFLFSIFFRYIALVKKYHPDGSEANSEKFQKIDEVNQLEHHSFPHSIYNLACFYFL